MSNWITITPAALEDITSPAIIAKINEIAGQSHTNPMTRAIVAAVARVRRAVSTGNALETDPATVPASLEAVTLRIARAGLFEFLRFPLDEDQKVSLREDLSDLKRISDERIRVEAPDNPLSDGQGIQRQPSPAVIRNDRKFTDRSTDGI